MHNDGGVILESIQIARAEPSANNDGETKFAKNDSSPRKNLLRRARFDQISVCPIRTCLWSRVGRRGSGQEASQPPLEDRQPEANRRTPPNGGRGLKQRRTGLFWSLPALQRSAIKEACLSCRACGRDLPRPNDGPERRSGLSLGRVMATAQQLIARGPRRRFSASSRAPSDRVGGSTTPRPRLQRAERTAVSPTNPSFARRGGFSAHLGDAAHDGPHQGIPRPQP